MKKQIHVFILTILFSLSYHAYSQGPPPPPPPDHNLNGDQNGGSAPVGSGLAILLGSTALYAGYKMKLFISNSKKLES